MAQIKGFFIIIMAVPGVQVEALMLFYTRSPALLLMIAGPEAIWEGFIIMMDQVGHYIPTILEIDCMVFLWLPRPNPHRKLPGVW